MKAGSEKTGNKQDGRFKPGVSGNPAGKPKGTRNKVTALVDALIEGEAEELAKVAIERAKAGDGPLLKALIERLSPPQRNRAVRIELPSLDDIQGVAKALGSVSEAVADGTITPDEGHTMTGILEARRKSFETVEMNERLSKLEQSVEGRK